MKRPLNIWNVDRNQVGLSVPLHRSAQLHTMNNTVESAWILVGTTYMMPRPTHKSHPDGTANIKEGTGGSVYCTEDMNCCFERAQRERESGEDIELELFANARDLVKVAVHPLLMCCLYQIVM
jgi:hypothetical protein